MLCNFFFSSFLNCCKFKITCQPIGTLTRTGQVVDHENVICFLPWLVDMLQRDKLFINNISLKSPHGSLGPRAMPNNHSVAVTIKLFLHEWNPYSFTCHHYKWWEAPIYLTSLSWRQVACHNFPRNTVFAVVFFGIHTLLSFASDWLKNSPMHQFALKTQNSLS